MKHLSSFSTHLKNVCNNGRTAVMASEGACFEGDQALPSVSNKDYFLLNHCQNLLITPRIRVTVEDTGLPEGRHTRCRSIGPQLLHSHIKESCAGFGQRRLPTESLSLQVPLLLYLYTPTLTFQISAD